MNLIRKVHEKHQEDMCFPEKEHELLKRKREKESSFQQAGPLQGDRNDRGV